MTLADVVRLVVRPLLPRDVRPRKILAGPLRGCSMVVSWHDYPAALLGYTERSLLRWLSATVQPGQTWLDVGAHYGYTSLAIARLVGPSGRVFAFEPVLSTAECLSQTRSLNKVDHLRVFRFGLAHTEDFNCVDVDLDRGMAQHGLSTGHRDRVSVVSLDRIWTTLSEGDDRLHGVKMDIQGMELNALVGMQTILAAHHPLVALEFHAGVDRTAILSLLADCGYCVPGWPVAPLSNETTALYANDRTYIFSPVEIA